MYARTHRAIPEVKERMRETELLRKYNVSLKKYEILLHRQNRVCGICGKPPKTKRLAVDHDHITGKVRGLLCGECNRVLGMFEDNVTRFQSAITYLQTA